MSEAAPTAGESIADPDLAQYRAQVAEEYGQVRATRQIYIGGALAFNPGDPVPASHPVAKDKGLVESVAKKDRA